MAGTINITRDYLTAGHSVFTVNSDKTHKHYTYRISKPRDFNELKPMFFVSVLTGPDNGHDYTYLGVLWADTMTVRTTAKSRFDKDSEVVKVLQWAIGVVCAGTEIPDEYAIVHDGNCGRCGRPLTHPESLRTGLGPVCAGR